MKRKSRNLRVYNVVDVRTGKVSPSRYLLGQMTQQQKHELRSQQLGHTKTLNYACPVCDQKVYLSGSGGIGGKTEYHFKHFPNAGDCPLKQGTGPSREDLLKMMYNGAKESAQHRDLKTWLGNFLHSIESQGDFANANIEKRITSMKDKLHWRQPDVSCTFRGKKLVFELQLNGTFVEVIQGREQFYKEEQTYICWLFDRFDPRDTSFGERDIFWLNKTNSFAITKEAMQLSEERQELHLECHFIRPTVEGDEVQDIWERCFVPFSSLTMADDFCKPFYFDSDSERKKLKEQVVIPKFMDFLLGAERKNLSYNERQEKDSRFVVRLKAIRPELEAPEVLTTEFLNIVDAIKFLKFDMTGVMLHSFNNIKQYTNQIIQFYPEFGYVYCMAVKTYRPQFKRDELGDKLKGKLVTFWEDLTAAQKAGTSDKQSRDFDGLLAVFFPELTSYLSVTSA